MQPSNPAEIPNIDDPDVTKALWGFSPQKQLQRSSAQVPSPKQQLATEEDALSPDDLLIASEGTSDQSQGVDQSSAIDAENIANDPLLPKSEEPPINSNDSERQLSEVSVVQIDETLLLTHSSPKNDQPLEEFSSNMETQACIGCHRNFRIDRIAKHEAVCLKNHPVDIKGKQRQQMYQSVVDSQENITDDIYGTQSEFVGKYQEIERQSCSICQRKFAIDRLEIHERTCKDLKIVDRKKDKGNNQSIGSNDQQQQTKKEEYQKIPVYANRKDQNKQECSTQEKAFPSGQGKLITLSSQSPNKQDYKSVSRANIVSDSIIEQQKPSGKGQSKCNVCCKQKNGQERDCVCRCHHQRSLESLQFISYKEQKKRGGLQRSFSQERRENTKRLAEQLDRALNIIQHLNRRSMHSLERESEVIPSNSQDDGRSAASQKSEIQALECQKDQSGKQSKGLPPNKKATSPIEMKPPSNKDKITADRIIANRNDANSHKSNVNEQKMLNAGNTSKSGQNANNQHSAKNSKATNMKDETYSSPQNFEQAALGNHPEPVKTSVTKK